MAKLTVKDSRLGTLGKKEPEPASRSSMVGYEDNQLLHVPLDHIRPNPDQPRKSFGKDALADLAESIGKRGVLQPILITPDPDRPERFLLVAGERRWRAAQIAGLRTIPTIFKRGIDTLELAIIENLQREDLNPVEEAEGLSTLKERQKYTDEQLGHLLGKSRVAVTELLALTRLPDEIKTQVRAEESISRRQLLQVTREKDPKKQKQLWKAIRTGDYTTREIEKIKKEGKAEKTLKLQRTAKGVGVTLKFDASMPKAEALKRAAEILRMLGKGE